MNVYIQRRIDEDWQVWSGERPDPNNAPDLVIFHPGDRGGYYLDAYSYGKTLADKLGCSLIDVPQDR